LRRVGVLTGLAAEARIVQAAAAGLALPPLLACAGSDSGRARREAERLVAEGAGALISFGLAGGLNSRLRPGDLIFADRVILPGGRVVETDSDWRSRLLELTGRHGLPVEVGAIAGSGRVLASAAQKRELAERTGGAAVDMESHAVAGVADAARLPVLAIRAVADTAEQTLPRAALIAVGADESPKLIAIVKELCLSPWDGPALWRLRRGAAAALAKLGCLIRLAGPALFTVG